MARFAEKSKQFFRTAAGGVSYFMLLIYHKYGKK